MSDVKILLPNDPKLQGTMNILQPGSDGHIHDNFRVDNKGSITDGHTTVQIKGGEKIPLYW